TAPFGSTSGRPNALLRVWTTSVLLPPASPGDCLLRNCQGNFAVTFAGCTGGRLSPEVESDGLLTRSGWAADMSFNEHRGVRRHARSHGTGWTLKRAAERQITSDRWSSP